MYLNKAIIYGNLTKDPELKSLPSGIQVASFSIATNRVFKDRDGNKKEQADFHNVVVFGRQAETAAQYLKKGSAAMIEGRMQTRSWDAEGGKKYRTEIIADRVQFGPRGSGTAAAGSYSGGATGGTASGAAKSEGGKSGGKVADGKAEKSPMDTIEYPEEEINPEDIPF